MAGRLVAARGRVLAALVVVPSSALATSPSHRDALSVTITGAGVITGTSGDDVMLGSSGADQIKGLGGNHELDGDHFPLADSSDDLPRGGSGNNRIFDPRGDNLGDGGQGRDDLEVRGVARGGSGDDPLVSAFWAFPNGCDPGIVARAEGAPAAMSSSFLTASPTAAPATTASMGIAPETSRAVGPATTSSPTSGAV